MNPKILLAMTALASAAIVLVALLRKEPAPPDSTLGPVASQASVAVDWPHSAPRAVAESAVRTAASAASDAPEATSTRAEAEAAVARGEVPPGFSRLHVEARRGAELVHHVSVALRGTADSIQFADSGRPWSYHVRAGAHVLIDVTDRESGWVQTETTVAPPTGEERTLTVQLNPPEIHGAVLLRLVSGADGAPIADAQVIAVSDDPPDFQQQASDATGRVRVPNGPNFSYVITASNHAVLELPAFEPTAKAFQTFEMTPFARVFGRVDPSQQGQGSIDLVEVLPDTGGPGLDRRRVLGSAVVLTTGAWEIGGLVPPKGTETFAHLAVYLRAEGTRRTIVEGLRLAPGESLEVLDRSRRYGPVTLEFLYPSGHPVGSGLSVLLRDATPTNGVENSAHGSIMGRLGEQGRVTFPSLAPGPWACRLELLDVKDLVISGDPVQTVAVEGQAMITGRVVRTAPPGVTPQGLPGHQGGLMSKQAILLHLESPSEGNVRSGNSDPMGRFRFDLVPAATRATLHLGDSTLEVQSGDLDVVLWLPEVQRDGGSLFLRGAPVKMHVNENGRPQDLREQPFATDPKKD